MACDPEVLKDVPLFALLDDDENAVLAAQVELKRFAARQRIYKMGDPGGKAYMMVSGDVQVTTVDEDHQEVVVDEPRHGEFFGFASMLEQTPHQTDAVAVEESVCMEVDRERHRGAARAQAARRHGYADRAGPPVPCLAATGAQRAPARNPERSDRRGRRWASASPTRWRASAARGPSSSSSAIVLAIYTAINVRLGKRPGIPIRSFC